MEINITPENIDALVKEAILKSAFGSTVAENLEKCFTGYDNPFKRVMEQTVMEITRKVLKEQFGGHIETIVKVKIEAILTDEVIEKLAENVTDNALRSINNY